LLINLRDVHVLTADESLSSLHSTRCFGDEFSQHSKQRDYFVKHEMVMKRSIRFVDISETST